MPVKYFHFFVILNLNKSLHSHIPTFPIKNNLKVESSSDFLRFLNLLSIWNHVMIPFRVWITLVSLSVLNNYYMLVYCPSICVLFVFLSPHVSCMHQMNYTICKGRTFGWKDITRLVSAQSMKWSNMFPLPCFFHIILLYLSLWSYGFTKLVFNSWC